MYFSALTLLGIANLNVLEFEKHMVVVPYKKVERSYEMHCRPLWDWALGLLDHPRLISRFVWDAERISKFNGSKWVRLYHEPWTANDWWNIQVCYILSHSTSSISCIYLVTAPS